MTVPPPSQPPPEDPHVGSEDDPRRELDPRDETAVVPPRVYQPAVQEAGSRDVAATKPPPRLMDRVVSASIPLSTLAFFVIGFSTGRWYVAWLVFLIPPILRAWNRG